MLAGTASRIVLLLTVIATPAQGWQAVEQLEPPSLLGQAAIPASPRAAAPLDTAVARVHTEAWTAPGHRLIISLDERLLLWMDGADTLRLAPIAIGKGTQLRYEEQEWDFSTPRGVRQVVSKETNPIWVPPDWHYVELARDSNLVLIPLPPDTGAALLDGTRVMVRGDQIVRKLPDGTAEVVPPGEEVVFGDTLFIPPLGTANRRIEGELGAYKLDLGDGYMIHGTPHKTSIGSAATHGCIRMRDGDLEYLYYRVPAGTPVYIY